ncbi:unnamed protein product [Phytomonas sp. Hart1]|nr:unnamed protein product [Phytomonas sp. Hart1]|eukprot:CCW66952.1 unnamed protein product [Phytomonas sp. isolate Hart1]
MLFQRPYIGLVLSLLFIAVAFDVSTAHGLKFIFDEEPEVCFVEEITSDTNFITGRYNWHDRPSIPVSLSLTLYTPSSQVVKTLEMKADENIFAIQVPPSAQPGAYLLCAAIRSPWDYKKIGTHSEIAVSFDVDQSYTSVVESPSPKKKMKGRDRETIDGLNVFSFRDLGGELKAILRPKEYLEELQWRVQTINEELDIVERNMIYSLNREDRMRVTSESTFTRVWIASLLTLAIMMLAIFTQFHALKSIIIKRKLV